VFIAGGRLPTLLGLVVKVMRAGELMISRAIASILTTGSPLLRAGLPVLKTSFYLVLDAI